MAGGAADEAGARRDAIAFASDLLKDIAAGAGPSSPFKLELRNGAEGLCGRAVALDACL